MDGQKPSTIIAINQEASHQTANHINNACKQQHRNADGQQ